MAYVTAKVKRWGNSLGLLIPRDVVVEKEISENDVVNVHILKKRKVNGFGLCRGKASYREESEAHKEIW